MASYGGLPLLHKKYNYDDDIYFLALQTTFRIDINQKYVQLLQSQKSS